MLKILNFNIFGGFQKNEYVWGYEDFVDIFFFFFFFGGGGSLQNWTIFKGHFYAILGLLLSSRFRMGDIFGGC